MGLNSEKYFSTRRALDVVASLIYDFPFKQTTFERLLNDF